MIRVFSTEFGKEVGRYQDVALSEPVIVTRNGRDRTVYAAGELPDDIVDAIARTEMNPRHSHLDALIEDWEP